MGRSIHIMGKVLVGGMVGAPLWWISLNVVRNLRSAPNENVAVLVAGFTVSTIVTALVTLM